ncbi:hypothetical protein WN55_05903, partial [Dufourea novaeangliae]
DSYRVPKIPTFFRGDPDLWFLQVQISFRNSRITAEAIKADAVLAALYMEVLSTVKDILLSNPTPADINRRIKSRIIATFAMSPEAKLRKLLTGQVLTDGKPSLILCRLRNLNDGACDDSVIRSIFFDQLPSTHRAILVATGGDDLNKLAEAADKLADSVGAADTCVATVSRRAPSQSTVESDIKRILASITSLSERVARLEARNNRPRSRAASHSH